MRHILKQPIKVAFGNIRDGEVFAFDDRQKLLIKVRNGVLQFNHRLNTVHEHAQAIWLDNGLPLTEFVNDSVMVFLIEGKFVEE